MSQQEMVQAQNRLAKWRSVFAGWLLGTRLSTDPQVQMIRDLTERTLLVRAEVSGITRVLIEKNIVTQQELIEIYTEEYEELSKMLEAKFPGATATDAGMEFDIQTWAETTKGWLP